MSLIVILMKSFVYITTTLVLYACETTVEVDIPRYPAQLTVNSLFYPDSVWQVELTQNRYILNNEPFASVPDAEVRVLQEGQTVAVLDYVGNAPFTGNSIYLAKSSYPQPRGNYTLNISHPTLGNLSASSRVPENRVSIVRAVLDKLDQRQESSTENNALAYGITLQFNDPPEENFYSLSALFSTDLFFGTDADGDGNVFELGILEQSDFSSIKSDDPIVTQVFDRYRDELIFSDASFNGQLYTLKLYLLVPDGTVLSEYLFALPFALTEVAYDTQGNVIRNIGELAGGGVLKIILRTTTEEYYSYYYTRDLQASVESNPFAQPVQVFDNIEGGLGIFAGYNQVERQVTIK